jgi:acyl carrier protein
MITNEKLIDILVESGADIDPGNIEVDKTFENIGLDSLDTYNFFTQIDDDLGVEVPDEVFEQLNTIDKVRKYLKSRLNG